MANRYLVTGGAGFIGSNYVDHLLREGRDVTIFDNLSRSGGAANLAWLRKNHGEDSFEMIKADIRDAETIASAAHGKEVIVHLAGQVAVTTSVIDPREDFEINALGTFNVLEAARLSGKDPVFLYSSTNKVYGGMEDVAVVEDETIYRYADLPMGAPESIPLDFHSPYGCSKGTGDQYVRDYARIYGLPTVAMRQSSIYGPRQFGIEDQGWLAWLTIAAVTGKQITIYGDGKQARDALHVADLVAAYELAIKNIDKTAGEVYNIGGGPNNTLTIWSQFGPMLEDLLGKKIQVKWDDWRPGDQRVFVSDIRKAEQKFGWKPQINTKDGVRKLYDWVVANQGLF
ncbi:MAG: GDP-mannose 4,6-dehydratase [Anaerolineae bacterium]|nr:GDP-mannose 4,6-dehydratase [Anaerolineae bacterium]